MIQALKIFVIDQGMDFTGPDEADLLLASSDALIAAQNTVISAEALGIGSCYIGDIMENYEIHKELFNLPPYVFPISMLCYGYYPEGERPKPGNVLIRNLLYQKIHTIV